MRRGLGSLLAAVLLAGCGMGAGQQAEGPASITVQRDFGARQLGTARATPRESDTILRVLQDRFAVDTAYGGKFVQAIEGLAGGDSKGRPVDWFYYVNGILAPKGAAETPLRAGDRVLWDFHDWGAAQDIPAIVGSFPEPFRSGNGGKRFPVRLECAPSSERACQTVADRFAAEGILLPRAALGAGAGERTGRIQVGPWATVRGSSALRQIESGPGASGVFVRPASDGKTFELLDERGEVAERLGAGTGLVAAVRYTDQSPTWMVTGTDEAGVRAAAAMLREDVLAGRFAALSVAGKVVSAPAVGGGESGS